jgi:hypothetical protein
VGRIFHIQSLSFFSPSWNALDEFHFRQIQQRALPTVRRSPLINNRKRDAISAPHSAAARILAAANV